MRAGVQILTVGADNALMDTRKATILLAEDGDDHARILRAVLERAGMTLRHVKNGVEAYELILSGFAFDLLITDVMMPGMTGFELLLRLKNEGRLPPTLVLTARKSEEDILRGLEYGALDYIPKPFSPSVVLARVKLALTRIPGAA